MSECIVTSFIISCFYVVQCGPVSSCVWSPCRWELERLVRDQSEITVEDTSNHSISWSWNIPSGKGTWLVNYKYTSINKVYTGEMRFINASNELDAVIIWGSAKNWSSNAVRIFSPPWNITYNGDIFGFQPSINGMYTLHVYTKNKRHNPFASYYIEEPCYLLSTDKDLVRSWWSSKLTKSCKESGFNWNFNTHNGSWAVFYKSTIDSSLINCSVFYNAKGSNETVNLITWQINTKLDTVYYRTTKDGGVKGEPAWTMDLNPNENWGFAAANNQGKWVFNHYSLGIIFRPFGQMKMQVTPLNKIK